MLRITSKNLLELREFEGDALIWDCAMHPAKYQGFEIYIRNS